MHSDREKLVERLRHRAETMNGAHPVGAGDGGTYACGYYSVADQKLDREAIAALTAEPQAVPEGTERARRKVEPPLPLCREATMASEALKPCPFCGGKAQCYGPDPDKSNVVIWCEECRIETPYGDASEAIAAWNRRAPAPEASSALGKPQAEWQPIETAPKDGTDIWVWSPIDKRAESIRYELYDDDEIAEEVGEPGFWRYSEDLIADVAEAEGHEFSHWMPLPSSPRKEGSGDA